jgi:hypothetical protein
MILIVTLICQSVDNVYGILTYQCNRAGVDVFHAFPY